MSKIRELLKQGRNEELWQMCCGFIDLGLEQFMDIQKRLLLEQIELLKSCELGRKVMRGAMPETMEEFREQVPLTTYADYCPELLERREDMLPAKPIIWQRTSGRSGEYPFKWVPVSYRAWQEMGPVIAGAAFFATCKKKGEIAIRDGFKVLYAVAPPPYTFGVFTHIAAEELGFEFLPPLDKAEGMSFEDRVREGFKMALSEGIDGFYGLPGVLVAIGEQFRQGSSSLKLSTLLSRPKALLRLTKGLIKSKLARRTMLPKDLWSLKGITAAGTDGVVYNRKIENMWGRYPTNLYGGTEALLVAVQTWEHGDMTFVPSIDFLEFIPEAEHFKWQLDHGYQPKTVLLDEVKAGENYEIVITNFHGGAMVRYRVGDMIRITALRNEKLDIDIPQMAFEQRADELIDIAGFTRLTERVIWQAIENTGIPYQDWTVRKETVGERPVLHLYLELKDGYIASEKGMSTAVHDQLKKLDSDYADLEGVLSLKPLEITLLAKGSFKAYMAARQNEGADLAHLKPPHINPSDKVLSWLGAKVKAVPEVEVAAEAKPEAVARR
jgi:hypothetical protein